MHGRIWSCAGGAGAEDAASGQEEQRLLAGNFAGPWCCRMHGRKAQVFCFAALCRKPAQQAAQSAWTSLPYQVACLASGSLFAWFCFCGQVFAVLAVRLLCGNKVRTDGGPALP